MNDKTHQPLVSVIMNCYNSDTFLKEAIDSVFAQSYSNWEIVFYDNNSSDHSAEIAKSYGHKIKYIKRENTIPLYGARNEAIKHAAGTLIAFLDCDDLWLPNKLETQVNMMGPSDKALCYSSVYCMQGKQRTTKLVKDHQNNQIRKLIKNYDITISSVMIKKEVFAEHGMRFSEHLQYSGDFLLCMLIAYRFGAIATSELLAYYRIHPQNVSHQMHYLDKIKEFDFVLSQFKLHFPHNIYQDCQKNIQNQVNVLHLKHALSTKNTKHARSIAFKLSIHKPKFMGIVALCSLPVKLSHYLIQNHLNISY